MSMGKTWKAPKGRRAPPLVLERARSRPPVDVDNLRRSMTDFIQKSVEGALQGTIGTPFRPTPPVTTTIPASKPFTFTDVIDAVRVLRADPIGDPATYTMHLTPAHAAMVARAERQARAGWCQGAPPSTPMGWTSCSFEVCRDEFMLRPVPAPEGQARWSGVHTHTRPKPPPIHPDPPKHQPPDGGDEAREELLALFGWCNWSGCRARRSYDSEIGHIARTIIDGNMVLRKAPCTIVLPDDPHGDVAPCGYVYPQCAASLKA